MSLALGGNHVAVDPNFPENTPCIGLDWFILEHAGARADARLRKAGRRCLHPGRRFQAVFDHANVSVRPVPLRYLIVTPNFPHWHHPQVASVASP